MVAKGTCWALVLYGKNLKRYLILDETSLFNGELYTILTNKEANGKKAQDMINVLKKISVERRNMVKEVTVDMAGNMNLITKNVSQKQK